MNKKIKLITALSSLLCISSSMLVCTNQVISNKQIKKATTNVDIIEYIKPKLDQRANIINVKDYNLTWDEFNLKFYPFYRNNPEYYDVFFNKNFIDEDKDGKMDYLTIEWTLDRSAELEEEWLLVEEKIKYCKTDIEKVLAINEYLCQHISYGDSELSSTHSIEGAILDGKAVCEGYALAFKYFMNRLNIPCNVVSGTILDSGAAHAWNQVLINDRWYFVDSTYNDLRNPKVTNHTHLLVSQSKLARTHITDWSLYEYCYDQTYDDMFWNDVHYEIVPKDGILYYTGYIHTSEGFKGGIFKYDLSTKSPTDYGDLYIQSDELWPNTNGGYSRGYERIAINNDDMYYNLSKSILKRNMITGETTTVFTLNNDEYIWDIDYKNGRLYYDSNKTVELVREYKSVVIDNNFVRKEQPLAVSNSTFNLTLGGYETIIKAAANGMVTYESLNPLILDVKVTYKDEAALLLPLKPGKAKLKVTASETDRFKEVSKIIEVNITKNLVDLYTAADTNKVVNNKRIFTGDIYISKLNGGLINPTGKLEVMLIGDGKELLETKQTYDLANSNPITYNLETDNIYNKYEIMINYLGDNNFNQHQSKKELLPIHNHTFKEIVNDRCFISTATCSYGTKYYKSCDCGFVSNEVFELNDKLEHNIIETYFEYKNNECYLNGICNDCAKKVSYKCNIKEEIIREATCKVEGIKKITAYFTLNGILYEDSKEIPLPTKHVFKEVIDAKYKVSDATCDNPSVYYKSCECGEKSTETFKANDKLSHEYKATFKYINDYEKCNVTLECKHCHNKVIETVNVTKTILGEATCKTKGKVSYSAQLIYDNKSYISDYVTSLPIISHDYKDHVCTMCNEIDPKYKEAQTRNIIIITVSGTILLTTIGISTLIYFKKRKK